MNLHLLSSLGSERDLGWLDIELRLSLDIRYTDRKVDDVLYRRNVHHRRQAEMNYELGQDQRYRAWLTLSASVSEHRWA